MRTIILILAIMSTALLQAQDKKKTESLVIRTTAVCDMCEKTIEGNLIYEKGVKAVDLVLAENIVKVDYDPRKTTPEAIRTALTKLGYYADDMPGDEKAFRDLPDCCQKEGCGGAPMKH
jgi:periplasmic mercuric ion binding protein